MTIAAGFPYRGGILLCADTQQEGGASKSFSPKIGLFECAGGKIAFAYSGNTNFSIAAAQTCTAKLRGITDPNEIVPELERAYDRQYRKTVYAHPDRQTDWSIPYGFLFAIRPNNQKAWLFASHDTTIRSSVSFECIGLGRDLGNYLLRTSYTQGLPEQSAILLAGYIIARVSDYVPGCGGPSDIVLLRHTGEHEFIQDTNTAGVAAYCEAFEQRARQLLLSSANLSLTNKEFEARIDGFCRWAKERREAFRAVVESSPQSPTADQALPPPLPE